MKHSEITVGVPYWYETGNDWGRYLTPVYNRFPCRRIDDKRYKVTGSSWSVNWTAVADPKGQYIAVQRVDENGEDDDRVRYVATRFIRDTVANVQARYDRQKAADKAAEEARQTEAADAGFRARALRTRLAALGLGDAVRVDATTGQGWGAGSPKVTVEFSYDAETALAEILDRLEHGRRCERELTEHANAGHFDPDFAARLENGAYDR